jgi:hypothetical protein
MSYTSTEVAEAIKAIEPNALFVVSNGDIDNIDWNSDDITQPSKADIEAKIAEQKTAYDNNEYQRDRAVAYASIQDQLDMQYWDSVNGTTTWKDHIAQVKSDNPKP